MAYGSPYQDLQASVEQSSGGLGTVGSVAYDFLKWSTWRNPWFTSRIGATGWDPAFAKTRPGRAFRTGLNRILAPEAHKMYSHLGNLQDANRATRATVMKGFRAEQDMFIRRVTQAAQAQGKIVNWKKVGGWADRRLSELEEVAQGKIAPRMRGTAGMYGTSESALTDALKNRTRKPKGLISRIIGVTGERPPSTIEEMVGKTVGKRIAARGGIWGTLTASAGSITKGARVNAALRVAGRAMTFASAPLLAFDAAQLAFSGFAAISEFGAAQAQRPRHMTGAGVIEHPGAANLRRKMIMEMHSSQFGPRRLIGNEARFLHT